VSPAAACALEPLLQRIGEQEAAGRPWVVSAAELRKLLGLAPADYYRRLAAAEAAGERLAGLATGNFAQENIGELVAVLELFCGREAERRLSEAGVFFDHVEQTEMLQVFHALNAQRVRSHPLRTEEFSAMLRAFGRWQRAIAVYLDEYLPVQSLIDEAVGGYCAGRSFTFPALARANVARLLHYFFQKHVLDAQRLSDPVRAALFAQAVREGYAEERPQRAASEEAEAAAGTGRRERPGSPEAEACRVMGIEPEALQLSLLKGRYKLLMKRYHPDLNPQGLRRCQEINGAYALLLALVERRS
jgi:hypothetical protein